MLNRLGRTFVSLLTLQIVAPRWRLPCFAALGAFVGLSLVVAHISRAASYLTDSPEACVNCHVMTNAYLTWQRSSDATLTTCGDCHVPQDNILSHYLYKARDGAWHTTAFTLRLEPQVLRLSKKAIPVIEANCRRCHDHELHRVSLAAPDEQGQRCWDCHRAVPHGSVRSLSTSPALMSPALPPLTGPLKGQGQTIGGRPVRPSGGEQGGPQ